MRVPRNDNREIRVVTITDYRYENIAIVTVDSD